MQRLQERYLCPNGDRWEIWLVIYDTDRYAPGGRDEVLQYQKNGFEVGHHTRHLDSSGRCIKENFHGITQIPADAQLV